VCRRQRFAIPFCPTRLALHLRGADYRVPSRGARRETICRDDEDRAVQFGISAQAKGRFDSRVPTQFQMGNRFHLIVDPRRANLSRLMLHVNGVCS
jgi:streptogramin lyase